MPSRFTKYFFISIWTIISSFFFLLVGFLIFKSVTNYLFFSVLFVCYTLYYKFIIKTNKDIISELIIYIFQYYFTNIFYKSKKITENNIEYIIKYDLLDNINYFRNNKRHREKDVAVITSNIDYQCEYWYEGEKIDCETREEFLEKLKKLKILTKTLAF
jgi:hypothetical protein